MHYISLLIIILLAGAIALTNGAPLDIDRSIFGDNSADIDRLIDDILIDGSRLSADGFKEESTQPIEMRAVSLNTQQSQPGMFFGGLAAMKDSYSANAEQHREEDYAVSDEHYNRILADLFEESRQTALHKMSNRNTNVERHLIDINGSGITKNDLDLIKRSLTTECAICLNSYEPSIERASLKCSHTFHKACIETWLHTSLTCPVCRKDVTQ